MQARWYSPGTATFRSRDTYSGDLNTPVSLNRYTYAGNNPIRYWDPTGFCFAPVAGAPACSPELLAGLDTAGAVNAAVGIQKQIATKKERQFFETVPDHALSVVGIAQGIQEYAANTDTGVYQAGEEISLVLLQSDAVNAVRDTYGIETREMGTSVVITRGVPWLAGGFAAILGMSSTDRLELDPADRIGESFEIIRDFFRNGNPGFSQPTLAPNSPLPVPNPGVPADFTQGGFSAVQNPVPQLVFAGGIHSVYGDGTQVLDGTQPPRLGTAYPNGADPEAIGPHSQLRWETTNNRVYQAREFDGSGLPVRDIDFTAPTFSNGVVRPGHPIPQQHPWIINDPRIGPRSNFRRGPGVPF